MKELISSKDASKVCDEFEMKNQAHEYSKRFVGRKTVVPIPDLALAFEAGWRASKVDRIGDE